VLLKYPTLDDRKVTTLNVWANEESGKSIERAADAGLPSARIAAGDKKVIWSFRWVSTGCCNSFFRSSTLILPTDILSGRGKDWSRK
jgi:hypothetical protein